MKVNIGERVPGSYREQEAMPCCANCRFGGYLGFVDGGDDKVRLCVCEILGEPEDANYRALAVEPLGICDAWKPRDRRVE